MARYVTREEIERLIPADVLARLADLNRDSVEDPGVVDDRLEYACDEVDSYCQTRYSVPFSTVPSIVRSIAARIARYHIHTIHGLDFNQGADQGIRADYKDAIAFLTKVGKGDVALAVQETNPQTPPSTVHVHAPSPVFDKGGLDGFGL